MTPKPAPWPASQFPAAVVASEEPGRFRGRERWPLCRTTLAATARHRCAREMRGLASGEHTAVSARIELSALRGARKPISVSAAQPGRPPAMAARRNDVGGPSIPDAGTDIGVDSSGSSAHHTAPRPRPPHHGSPATRPRLGNQRDPSFVGPPTPAATPTLVLCVCGSVMARTSTFSY